MQSGRTDAALKDWRRCIELVPAQLPKYLKIAINSPELRPKVEALLPDAPGPMVETAANHMSDSEDDRLLRETLLARASSVLDKADLQSDERHYLRGRILSLREQTPQAIKQYSIAVELRPEDTQWRYELAMLLHSSGQVEQAKDQVATCLRMDPENKRFEDLLRQLIRAELTSQ